MTGEHNTEQQDDWGMELLAHFDMGRQEAISEVLEQVNRYRMRHQDMAADSSMTKAIQQYHGTKAEAFNEVRTWLLTQIEES